MRRSTLTPSAVSLYLPQFFIGFFFIAAAYLKATEGLFGAATAPLTTVMETWKLAFMPDFYMPFADRVIIPHADFFAALVIVLQGTVGVLLVANRHVRIAGALLFFVQLNIYLAVYDQLELRVFNSQAMLLGIYFFARSDMNGKVWKLFTYALVLIGFVHLYGRYVWFGDPWTTSYFWQRQHFSAYVMSAWPGLKYFTLWLTAGTAGPLVWASSWWLKLALFIGMLTKYRLQAGTAWLVYVTIITLVWLNVFSCEGVFWVLTMFMWVAHEHHLQKTSSTPLASYLP